MAPLLAIVAIGSVPVAAATFTSAKLGMTMRYPPGWTRMQPDLDTLLLARPFVPFHGPIQPRGQARIAVGPADGPGNEAAILDRYAAGGTLGRRDIIDTGNAGAPCAHFARGIVTEDVVPPDNREVRVRDIRTTVLVCTTPRGAVVGTASAWIDDPQRVRADADLLRIMRSLRDVIAAPARRDRTRTHE